MDSEAINIPTWLRQRIDIGNMKLSEGRHKLANPRFALNMDFLIMRINGSLPRPILQCIGNIQDRCRWGAHVFCRLHASNRQVDGGESQITR